MTRSTIKSLVSVLGVCCAGFAFAGADDITKRDRGGASVELTNLGEEDAPVVVAAPARTASGPVTPVAAERPASVRPAVQREKRLHDKDEEEVADGEQTGRTEEPRGDQSAGTGRSDWDRSDSFAASSGFTGNYGYGAPTYGGSSGGVSSGGGTNSGTDGATSNGGSGANGGGTSTPPATPPPTALDSPSRWENYQQIMLNEPRGSNGQVANPAVQRRYLMTNRAGYTRFGY